MKQYVVQQRLQQQQKQEQQERLMALRQQQMQQYQQALAAQVCTLPRSSLHRGNSATHGRVGTCVFGPAVFSTTESMVLLCADRA